MPRGNKKGWHFRWTNKPADLPDRFCLYCGEKIEDVRHPNQKFCCFNHRRWYEEDKKLAQNAEKIKNRPTRICVVCNQPFVFKIGNQKACSPHCSAELERARWRKYNYKRPERMKQIKEYTYKVREQKKLRHEQLFGGQQIY